MKGKKVVIIGIDALDPILVNRWIDQLSNFKKLKSNGVQMEINSVIPPDSIPAWASIYTGMTPARHKISGSVDYLRKDLKVEVDTSFLRGKTFWDIAGKEGRKVIVVNPFLAYPVWRVNGIMISGPIDAKGPVQTYPESLSKVENIPPMGGIEDFPTKKDLGEIYKNSKKITEKQAKLGLKLLKKHHWDLYFICFLTLDRVQHFFWRFHDVEDPTYEKNKKFKSAVFDFYKLYDKILGEFLDAVDDDTTLIVLSDHGHGRRSTEFFNVNEFLRRRGYLRPKSGKGSLPLYLLEKGKGVAARVACHFGLEPLLFKLGRYLPKNKEIQRSSMAIDFDESIAYASDFAGMTSFGGIIINSEHTKAIGLDYHKIRQELKRELAKVETSNGKRVVRWIANREDIYPEAGLYPDVIFRLEDKYGINWSLYDSLFSPNYVHRLVSGGHKEKAVCFFFNSPPIATVNPSIIDVAPTVLEILGVNYPKGFDGKSLIGG